MNKEELVAEVVTVGRFVRQQHHDMFDHGRVTVNYKTDESPVTQTDEYVNHYMGQVAQKYGLGYIAEEGNGAADKKRILLVDPIDGTIAFMRGMNTATVIATIMEMDGNKGTPVMSCIHEPLSGRTWVGEIARETLYYAGDTEPSRPKVFFDYNKSDQIVIRTNICAFPGASHNLVAVKRHVESSQGFNNQDLGGFGIAVPLIVSNLLDVTMIGRTSAVEAAAMQLIIRGAGGIALDLSGYELDRYRLGNVRGKVDFELPQGALFATDQHIAELMFDVLAITQ